MAGLRADVAHALRLYRKTPASTAIAIVVLAVAIAVLTTLFALGNAMVLRTHPGIDVGGRLATIYVADGKQGITLYYDLVARIGQEVSAVESIAGAPTVMQALDTEERPTIPTELVTSGYSETLAPKMQLGRPFAETDHQLGADPVVILSDALWRRHFDARRNVLGERVGIRGPTSTLLGDETIDASETVIEYRIIGVMAPEMEGTFRSDTSAWMPYEPTVDLLFTAAGGLAAAGRSAGVRMYAIARLARGVSIHALRNQLHGRYTDHWELGTGTPGVRLEVMGGVFSSVPERRAVLTQVVLFFVGAVLLVLVATCNVSLFLLSRAPGRQRELAIRMAVGAPLARLARQLATEGAVLVFVAAILGFVLALWLTVLMGELPIFEGTWWQAPSAFDPWVLAGITAAAVLIAVLVSLAPILYLKRIGIGSAAARTVASHAGWPQRIVATLQLSLAGVVGGMALALLWHLVEVTRADHGFSAENVVAATLWRPPGMEGASPDAQMLERQRRAALLAALPGVQEVGFGTSVPGMWIPRGLPVASPDEAEPYFMAWRQSADPGYFDVLGATLLAGRMYAEDERDRVVVNESFAQRVWGHLEVVGEAVPMPAFITGAPRMEVVGVIRNIAYAHPSVPYEPIVYEAVSPYMAFGQALVRTHRTAADLREDLSRLVDDGALPGIGNVVPLDDLWRGLLSADRLRFGLTAMTAVIVVGLASFGFFGMQRHLVAVGRREHAIRASMGAGPRVLHAVVFKRALALAGPGLALGGLLSFVAVAALSGDVVSRSVSPLVAAVSVVGALGALVLLASLGPAREAMRTTPAALLRED